MRLGEWWVRAPEALRTQRLELVPITLRMLEAERGEGSLGELLKAHVTHEWPPSDWEPHVLDFIEKQVRGEAHAADWHRYMVLREGVFSRTLVGCIGAFPKDGGDAEIGYSTLPAFQRRGFASEAARALVQMLLGREQVRSVSAQTFESVPESIKVMERAGMRYAGRGDEDGTVRYRCVRSDH